MPLMIDHAAKEIATKRSALPECLHIPAAAKDEAAVRNFIGDPVQVFGRGTPSRALVVKVVRQIEIDQRLLIWKNPNFSILHHPLQVWVRIDYNRYRWAYKRAFPDENIADKVLAHCMNRRFAALMGFEYVRIVPTARQVNSSSAHSENWGIDVYKLPKELESFRKRNVSIHYADLVDLMVMMDMMAGGGVRELVNEAQSLVRLPKV